MSEKRHALAVDLVLEPQDVLQDPDDVVTERVEVCVLCTAQRLCLCTHSSSEKCPSSTDAVCMLMKLRASFLCTLLSLRFVPRQHSHSGKFLRSLPLNTYRATSAGSVSRPSCAIFTICRAALRAAALKSGCRVLASSIEPNCRNTLWMRGTSWVGARTTRRTRRATHSGWRYLTLSHYMLNKTSAATR